MHMETLGPAGKDTKHVLDKDSGSLSAKCQGLLVETKITVNKDGSTMITFGS